MTKTISQSRSHSFSQLERARVRHIHLDIHPKFDDRTLECVATLDVQRAEAWPDAPIVLDTEQLDIREVSASSNGLDYQPAKYELGAAEKILGSPLSVTAPASVVRVKVAYSTSPEASALQWLDSSQTSSRLYPFLFTQSQSIHARSWMPIQDTPALRVTFSTVVHAPPGMIALMSAGNNAESTHTGPHKFYMEHPVPPYLIALAIGRLDFAAISARTGVYAEPSLIQRAAHEFRDTERMIDAAERLYGQYRWGRYDLLVLPPSFPYGGMENPRLTFLTPTVITGDGSLVTLIAHELAHSWAGNLVTNANWGDFWLNEGFTTYIEHRIQEELYGRDRVEVEEVLSRLSLEEEMSKLEDRDQILDMDLTGRDPDEAVTSVPYVKGALFLQSLEQIFGRETFDHFLRDYFDHFAFQSVTTNEAIQYLRKKLLNSAPGVSVPVEEWLSKPGLPDSAPKTESRVLQTIRDEASLWKSNGIALTNQQSELWDTHQWLFFLREVDTAVTSERMAELDDEFGLSHTKNSEILAQWLLMSVRHGYQSANPSVEEFLASVGRLKYIKPIYEELATTPEGHRLAGRIFRKARCLYHPIARTAIEQVLSPRIESPILTTS
jgi:leukotriene-A4 hydrolase